MIGDLLDDVLQRISTLSEKDMVRILVALHDAFQERDIQIYLEDAALQTEVQAFRWSGEIQAVDDGQDYLMAVNTNLQGGKSDAKIQQTIQYSATVSDDGTIIGTAVIERTHTGQEGEPLYGLNNVSYLRLYVPEGSELLDAGGFTFPAEDAFFVPEDWYGDSTHLADYEKEEGVHIGSGTRVTREFGKTAFGNWVMTPPGRTSKVFFTYRLPFRLWEERNVPKKDALASYVLFIQKQSGTHDNVRSAVSFSSSWSPRWVSKEGVRMSEHGVEEDGAMTEDRFMSVIMKKDF
ncbi:MAG: hypothetical protein AAB932_00125 [Patescibacteria group bacterium]